MGIFDYDVMDSFDFDATETFVYDVTEYFDCNVAEKGCDVTAHFLRHHGHNFF